MTDYSRSSKPKKDKIETKKKISEGLNAFHKGLAILGSILGLITASITIYNFTHKDEDKSKSDSTPSTVIIQQGGNTDSQATTDSSESLETSTNASETGTVSSTEATADTTTSSAASTPTTDTVSTETTAAE